MNKTTRCLLALASLPFINACRDAPPSATLLPPVRVMQIASVAGVELPVTATGQVRAGEELPLSFKIGGIVRDVRVTAGQRVAAGTRLATLDQTEIGTQVATAKESLLRAERELQRAVTLRAKGMVAERAEQDARTQRDQAQEALRAAEFNSRHAAIDAPGSGVILTRRAEAGETVAAGQPVLVFGRIDHGWVVKTGVPPADAVRLIKGSAATVNVEPLNRTLSGKIQRVAVASEAGTGTVEVEIALAASDAPLMSGMMARISLAAPATTAKGPVTLLPLTAVLEGHGGKGKVFLLEAGDAVKRLDVTTGRLLPDGRIEVLEGLPEGARIVVEGAAWLTSGDKVRVLN